MRAPAAVALVVASLGLAACGDEENGSSRARDTDIAITLDPDGPGGEPAVKAEVACPGADAPPQACETIEDLPDDAAAPVPPQTPCTEIYGGPDIVTIEGKLNGERVDARLTRQNGCEIDRFERFEPLLASLFPEYEPGSAIGP